MNEFISNKHGSVAIGIFLINWTQQIRIQVNRKLKTSAYILFRTMQIFLDCFSLTLQHPQKTLFLNSSIFLLPLNDLTLLQNYFMKLSVFRITWWFLISITFCVQLLFQLLHTSIFHSSVNIGISILFLIIVWVFS